MLPFSRRKPDALRLTPELLLAAYAQGLFPMARSRRHTDVEWFSPDPRAILPMDQFHCPRNVRQTINRRVFEIRMDTAFEQVVEACAAPRRAHHDTWINAAIVEAYIALHHHGRAHCVEAWKDGRLVGGLYGVVMGGGFFGESMFHRPDLGGSGASKVCLARLVEHLRERGFVLLDVQINSDHMRQFGAIDIPRSRYMALLDNALERDAAF